MDATKQTITFSEIGTTLMLCANMEYEQQILKALESVKGYKAGKGCVELTNGSGKAVLLAAEARDLRYGITPKTEIV